MTTINAFFTSRPALTAGILNHLWQSSAVGIVILGLLLLGVPLSARTRRGLAWLALAKFALPIAALVSLAGPLGNLFGGGMRIDRLQLPAMVRPMMLPGSRWATPSASGGFMAREFWTVAAGLWAAGFAGLIGFWAFRVWRLRRQLLAAAAPLPGSLSNAIAAAARRMGQSAPPRCLSVETGYGPGVLGVLAPVVLLPRGIEATLLPEELEAILIHEFVHVRRRDPWSNFLQMLLVSAFWFNPVIWLLQRRLKIETEKSCDEWVLAITADPDTYASGIVKTVRFSLGLPQIGFASAAMPPVASRLKEILSRARRPERRALRWATLGAGVTLLAFSGYAGSIDPKSGGAAAADPSPPTTTAAAEPTPPKGTPDESIMPVGESDEHLVATYQLPVMIPAPKPVGSPSPALAAPVEPTPVVPAMAVAAASSNVPPAAPAPALTVARAQVVVLGRDREPILPPVKPVAPPAVVQSAPAPTGPQLFQPRDLDQQPKATKQPRPVYPFSMKKQGISGEAVIEFIVDSNGLVQNVHAVSSTNKGFENNAAYAVSKWRFKPGRKNGVAVNTLMRIPIVFSLNSDG